MAYPCMSAVWIRGSLAPRRAARAATSQPLSCSKPPVLEVQVPRVRKRARRRMLDLSFYFKRCYQSLSLEHDTFLQRKTQEYNMRFLSHGKQLRWFLSRKTAVSAAAFWDMCPLLIPSYSRCSQLYMPTLLLPVESCISCPL